ncbi:type II toxin-antitoxin system RelE/ParE family toxin [Paracraurococcus lichenis]|uniref:Type II toxin-antitoxin system RelE/ParE family toxin n=1 Tax=Paracraurococcus lichenis TaxID=3064888 RepID=A0ABT9DV07_9PROT|nr:type II toxin-antitoxin system RelE/ParE family toxin [Paracraurococcus sp. LOR1-02]MDO9707732.1 type II toxin-antitoxin system RelE/ParE family toxin [Paracraurococcus sp. LOR1-02]
MITVAFARRALADLRLLRAFIIAGHPDGQAAGERLADAMAARLARAIEALREFPRMGQPGDIPDTREITVPGPTRRLTCRVGYRPDGDRVTVLGITWGGRHFTAADGE